MGSNYRRWLYALVVLLTVGVALYLSGWLLKVAQTGGNVVGLYFFAWLLQFLFTPLVDLLARRGIPRVLAVSFVYLLLALGAAVFFYATIPGLFIQGQRLAAELSNPKTYQGISSLALAIESFLEHHFHIPHKDIARFTETYSVSFRNGAVTAGTALQRLINSLLTPGNLSNSATAVLSFLGALNAFFLNLVIVLILAFYMMLDGHTLVHRALAYFPPAADEVMERVHQIINRKFGGYLRSQLILAFSYGLLTYIIAVGFAVRYSTLIAAVAAIAMLIPFVGAFVAVVPPLIGFILVHVTDATFPWGRFVLLLVFLVVAQHVVLNLLAPRVMGSALGMHPLLVMLGLVLGAEVGGLWGAIFGVPILGVLLDIVDMIYRRVMDQRYGFHPRRVLPAADAGAGGPAPGEPAPDGSAPAGSAPDGPAPDGPAPDERTPTPVGVASGGRVATPARRLTRMFTRARAGSAPAGDTRIERAKR